MAPELRYVIGTVVLLGVTLLIPGGRVLVLPVLFVLILILLFWAAKPGAEE
jgi:hypothetical protein